MYLTAGDGEPGAEVVAAATTTDQARLVFAPIKQLAASAPALRKYVTPLQNRIVHEASGSYFAVVSSLPSNGRPCGFSASVMPSLYTATTSSGCSMTRPVV